MIPVNPLIGNSSDLIIHPLTVILFMFKLVIVEKFVKCILLLFQKNYLLNFYFVFVHCILLRTVAVLNNYWIFNLAIDIICFFAPKKMEV